MKEINEGGYWRAGWDSFEAWYADPELGMKTSTVYHAIKLIETFPDWKKLIDIPVSKLIMIVAHTTEKNKTDLIVAARSLGRGDLRHELLTHGLEPERKTGVYVPKTFPCKSCGGVRGITFDDLCHCGWTKKQIEYIGELIDKIEFGGDI